jgi:amidohydrolase
MLEDGLLQRFPFDEVYGFHNMPYFPAGVFTICPGYMMAGTDFFEITLSGRGGHAAIPNACDDVIVAGSALVSALQSLVSRERDPLEAAVLSITNFQAGTGAANVIPARAVLGGTVRTFKPSERARIRERMTQVIEHCSAMFRLQSTFDYKIVTDSVFNHAESVDLCRDSVTRLFGPDALKPQTPMMVGEDFGSFLERRPGAFIFLGQADGGPDGPHSQGVHTSRYDFNDAIIPRAVEYFAELAETRGQWD